MTTKHTPEPWRIDEYRNFVTPDGPLYLGGVTTPLALGEDMRKGWENARRIVACVNACEGIITQNLEDNVPFLELARRYNVVLRERDALRAELANAQPAPSVPDGWLRAVDEALVIAHIGVANAHDTYEQAKAKLDSLIGLHVDIATDPAVNGGYKLMPVEPTKEIYECFAAYDGTSYSNPFDFDDFREDYLSAINSTGIIKHSPSVPDVFAWPECPKRRQSHVLFDDGYEEGWAACIATIKAALAAPEAKP